MRKRCFSSAILPRAVVTVKKVFFKQYNKLTEKMDFFLFYFLQVSVSFFYSLIFLIDNYHFLPPKDRSSRIKFKRYKSHEIHLFGYFLHIFGLKKLETLSECFFFLNPARNHFPEDFPTALSRSFVQTFSLTPLTSFQMTRIIGKDYIFLPDSFTLKAAAGGITVALRTSSEPNLSVRILACNIFPWVSTKSNLIDDTLILLIPPIRNTIGFLISKYEELIKTCFKSQLFLA